MVGKALGVIGLVLVGGAGGHLATPQQPAPPPQVLVAPASLAQDVAVLQRDMADVRERLGDLEPEVVKLNAHSARVGDGVTQATEALEAVTAKLAEAVERMARLEGALGVEPRRHR